MRAFVRACVRACVCVCVCVCVCQRLQVSHFIVFFYPISRSPGFLWLAPATMAIGDDTPILPVRLLFLPFCGVNVHNSKGKWHRFCQNVVKESIPYAPIYRIPLKSSIFVEHNAENLVLMGREHAASWQKIHVDNYYLLKEHSMRKIMSYLKSNLCLPLPRVVKSHVSHI